MSGWWTAAFVAQWVLLVVLCVVVVALARQVGTLHLRLGPRGALEIDTEGPPLGEALPPVEARGADGAPVVLVGPPRPGLLAAVGRARRVLLLDLVVVRLPGRARARVDLGGPLA